SFIIITTSSISHVSTPLPYTTLFRPVGLLVRERTDEGQRRDARQDDRGRERGGPRGRAAERPPPSEALRSGRRGRVDDRGGLHEIGRHTSELQSRSDIVCRLLLDKNK